jgi:lambda repressor-like predicted transcriptional regulator
VAAEEKRRIGQVLKVPRRTRDRDDIVLGVRAKGFSLQETSLRTNQMKDASDNLKNVSALFLTKGNIGG